MTSRRDITGMMGFEFGLGNVLFDWGGIIIGNMILSNVVLFGNIGLDSTTKSWVRIFIWLKLLNCSSRHTFFLQILAPQTNQPFMGTRRSANRMKRMVPTPIVLILS